MPPPNAPAYSRRRRQRRRRPPSEPCFRRPPPRRPPRRGQLSAGQRRVAYDSLGMYQQLQGAGLEPLSPEAWAAAHHFTTTVSAILAADGVR